MANENLTNAKTAKNDEFYTQYHDIEAEMSAYLEYNPDVFRGKTVLMPCDDPESSNFTRYFAAKFAELGLKRKRANISNPIGNPHFLKRRILVFVQKRQLFAARFSRWRTTRTATALST